MHMAAGLRPFQRLSLQRRFSHRPHHARRESQRDTLLDRADMRIDTMRGRQSEDLVTIPPRTAHRCGCHAGIPREVINAWQGHRPDRSVGSAYHKLSDAESQRFMKMVPFGTGKRSVAAGVKEARNDG
jgi:hypothetical protein